MGRPSLGKPQPYAEIGARIREARERMGRTQTEMARLLGFQHQSGYQKIESGQIRPSVDVLQKLTDLLGISADDVIFGMASSGEKAAGPPQWSRYWMELLGTLTPEKREFLRSVGQALQATELADYKISPGDASRLLRSWSAFMEKPTHRK